MTFLHLTIVPRLAIALATCAVGIFPIGVAGQVDATPEPPTFHLVAKVRVEEWVSPLPVPEPGAGFTEESLLASLREGGFVIYFRHASTDFSQVDADPVDLKDCATQRNLSNVGRDESRRIGASIDDLGIPIGDVFTSEMCRARDTAELAFGEAVPVSALTALDTVSAESEEDERTEALRTFLGMPPETGTNTVLVGHLVNITVAANVTLDEAEAAIFLPSFGCSGRVGE